ncbi:hypothetical protein CN918_31675 [Priestia megaterium]|nr:hypothetical protein CN918_31675 [Priestia megaterium]
MVEMILALIGLAALAWLTEQFFTTYHDENIQNYERNKRLWLLGTTLILTVIAIVVTIIIV